MYERSTAPCLSTSHVSLFISRANIKAFRFEVVMVVPSTNVPFLLITADNGKSGERQAQHHLISQA